jgi:hypothetical protein
MTIVSTKKMSVLLVAISMSCSVFGAEDPVVDGQPGRLSQAISTLGNFIPAVPINRPAVTSPLKAKLAALVVPALGASALFAAHKLGYVFPQGHPYLDAGAVGSAAFLSYLATNNFTPKNQAARGVANVAQISAECTVLRGNMRKVLGDANKIQEASDRELELILQSTYSDAIGKNHPYPNVVIKNELHGKLVRISTELKRDENLNEYLKSDSEALDGQKRAVVTKLESNQTLLQYLYDRVGTWNTSTMHGIKYAKYQAALMQHYFTCAALGTVTAALLLFMAKTSISMPSINLGK